MNRIRGSLERVFRHIEVEWRANKVFLNTRKPDDLRNISYCPRADFAIGPFNNDLDSVRQRSNITGIGNMCSRFRRLIDEMEARDLQCEAQWWEENIIEVDLQKKHRLTRFVFNRDSNKNPRCFMAIEVEKRTGQKHRMGSIVNAAALGKVGVLVAKKYDGGRKDAYPHLVKIRLYLRFLLAVGKPGIPIRNLLILPEADFVEILEQHPSA